MIYSCPSGGARDKLRDFSFERNKSQNKENSKQHTMTKLFTPYTIGGLQLKHRVVMAPLTRRRAGENEVPRDMSVEYYRQRASTEGTLIISEATQICPGGQGYPNTPGIHSKDQVEAWTKIVDAVHSEKSYIFAQLWHVGRVSHTSFSENGELPVSSSEVPAEGNGFTKDNQLVPYLKPHALTVDEIKNVVDVYRAAAQNAKDAGFDGVELHSANGYLCHQFLEDGVNQRTDQYGGSYENRSRFLLEIIDAISTVYPTDRIGVRLAPWGPFLSMSDSNPLELYKHVLQALDQKNISYVHLIEARIAGSAENKAFETQAHNFVSATLRPYFKGTLIAAGGYTRETAIEAVENGIADLVAFGRYFISNPDLPIRLQTNSPLTPYDRSTFYLYTEEGYTDYPFLE